MGDPNGWDLVGGVSVCKGMPSWWDRAVTLLRFKPVVEEIVANPQRPATGNWCKEGDSDVKELFLQAEDQVN